MTKAPDRIVATACIDVHGSQDHVRALLEQLPRIEFSLVILLASNLVNLTEFVARFETENVADHVMGCRTAGEICSTGYADDRIVLLAFPKSHFETIIEVFTKLEDIDEVTIARSVLARRQDVQANAPNLSREFAFLLVDGLSKREDKLVSFISTALGSTQLFGGSSGDGLRFEHAPVFYQGKIYENAAILAILRTNCRIKIFREDHLTASEKRLVVTGAIPEERLVTEINAEPAAPEYARIVGIDPLQLSPFIFASHPIVVSAGHTHHVRAIQKVEDDKYLRFFSSIDEGMVLTVADAKDITEHLSDLLETLRQEEEPDLIFACDCILRKLEAEQKQQIHKMSELLLRSRVIGFSTYGEQHNMLHVNQTLTGIAIYPPNDEI